MEKQPTNSEPLSPVKQAIVELRTLRAKLKDAERVRNEPIAVIGMGCRFPGGANDPQSLWKMLCDGTDAIREVPRDRWDIEEFFDSNPDAPGKMSTRWGGFLDAVDKFDADFFGISPREAVGMDPQQRLFLEVGWEAFENAGQSPEKLLGSQTGVFLGIASNDYAQLQMQFGAATEIDAYLATGTCHSVAPGRLSYTLGLQGPSVAIDTACSSSLVAVHLACQSLRLGDCRMALAGGVNVILAPELLINFTKSHMMATDGRCKTFDASADGFVRGEGCGAVVLKRLSDAIADGDTVLAVIRGTAINQDGRSSGLTVPNGVSQQEVIRRALANAEIDPSDVGYVETHGTGTSLGDPIEVHSLNAVYGQNRAKENPLALGSIKTNVGHLETAAGVAGLLKAILILQHGEIPPHLHLTNLNPHIPWSEFPLSVPTSQTDWVSSTRRVAAVSSFGFSGTNAHVIVAEAEEPSARKEEKERQEKDRGFHVLTLSAKTPGALQELATRYAEHLGEHPELSLGDVCHTANSGRSHFEHRLATVVASTGQLQERLKESAAGENPLGVLRGQADLSRKPEVVFLFTGQGGQYLQMGRVLYETEPVFREVVDRCAELVRPYLEIPLQKVLYPEPGEASPLDDTSYTHVAMFAVQYGLAQLWRSWGVEPAAVLGHSVGEIAASAVAGGMSMEDGLKLMRERGRLMQSLPRTGLMASLLAGEKDVAPVVERYRDRVAIAAINGPESTVISGEAGAVREVLRELEARGIKTKPLNVSNSFHSPLVEPVLGEFTAIAKTIEYQAPQLAQYSSMRLAWIDDSNKLDGAYWGYNLRNTVRFSEAMAAMYAEGYRIFVEIGPSPTLVGIGSQCVPAGEGVWLPSLRRDRNDWDQILESLATLYINGASVEWKALDGKKYQKVTLPTYPFQRERFAIEKPGLIPGTTRDINVTLPSGEPTLTAVAMAGAALRTQWVPSPGGAASAGIVRLFDDHNNVVAEISVPRDTKGSAEIESSDFGALNDWTYRTEWERKELAKQKPTEPGKKWLIIADRAGVATTISSLLQGRRDHSVVIQPDPADESKFQSTIQSAIESLGTLDGIIDLSPLDCPTNDDLTSDSLGNQQLQSCGTILRLLQTLRDSTSMQRLRMWVVTRGSQPVGPRPTVQVGQAPVRGLARVVAMEHPELRCEAVDLDPQVPTTDVNSLLQEISFPDDEDQVAFRNGTRHVARLRRTTIAKDEKASTIPTTFSPDATYLITGGLGDLGMRVAQWMATKGARHLVLMGRRQPSAEANEVIANVQKSGAKVVVFQGDVSRTADVEQVISMIEHSMPPLRGIMHAAGVWKGGVILQQDLHSFLEVLAPKVQGAWNLHQRTLSAKLDFFMMFSSGASVLGAAGLADYASANAFLDALAHYRQSKGLPGASINWGPWADLGMVRSVTNMDTARWSEHGMSYIPPAIALFAMEEVIRQQIAQVCVLPIDWQRLKSGIPTLAKSSFVRDLVINSAKSAQVTDKKTMAAELTSISDPGEQERFLQERIQAEAARILRLPSAKLDLTKGLNQFGMDSLMALELRNRLQSELGIPISLASLLAGPSVTELSTTLLARFTAESKPADFSDNTRANAAAASALDSHEAQQLLKKVSDLSDKEIDSLLGRMVSDEAGRGREK